MNEQKDRFDNERILVFRRLMQKKEQILVAACEIEDLRNKYINQNRKDDNGSIESEIYKRLYTIIECFSELVGYTKGRGNGLLTTLVNYTMFNRSTSGSKFLCESVETGQEKEFHIAGSKVLDAVAAAANSLMVTWSFKREPIVSIGKLESILQVFKLSGN